MARLRRYGVTLLVLAALLAGFLGGRRLATRLVKGTPVSAQSIAGKTIVIDPGHGGKDTGAKTADGTPEKDIVLAISHDLAKLLTAAGARVVMIRTADVELATPEEDRLGIRKTSDLDRRVQITAQTKPDAMLSIHANWFSSSAYSGAQVFYHPDKNPENEALSVAIQQALKAHLGSTREAKVLTKQRVLKMCEQPACTVEVGFLSNPREAAKLKDPEYRRQVAWAIFVGLAKYFAMEPPLRTGP